MYDFESLDLSSASQSSVWCRCSLQTLDIFVRLGTAMPNSASNEISRKMSLWKHCGSSRSNSFLIVFPPTFEECVSCFESGLASPCIKTACRNVNLSIQSYEIGLISQVLIIALLRSAAFVIKVGVRTRLSKQQS